jgi:8-oxo-dGTP pyrophosphatase MutT (NUDIX family)
MQTTPNPLIESAVLVPVFRRADGVWRIVLVHRSDHGVHGGQIGFPGGKCDVVDRSLLETALREASEEIGLSRDRVKVIEALPPVETLTTAYRISPFLAQIDPPPEWTRSEEIVEVLEVAVDDLTKPEAHGEDMAGLPGWTGPRPLPFFKLGTHRIWGATYRILQPLLPRLQAGNASGGVASCPPPA